MEKLRKYSFYRELTVGMLRGVVYVNLSISTKMRFYEKSGLSWWHVVSIVVVPPEGLGWDLSQPGLFLCATTPLPSQRRPIDNHG